MAIAGALLLTVGLGPTAAAAAESIPVKVDFTWTGTLSCATERAGSVICISAKATVAGLGDVEYARDAVPAGGNTKDGCPMFSTHGTIYVPGGTAVLDGTPAPTCGTDHVPDANYLYTISGGTGVLVGAAGSGSILADKVDRWVGTFVLAAPLQTVAAVSAAAPSTAPSANIAPAAGVSPTKAKSTGKGVPIAILAAMLTAVVVVMRRRRSARPRS